MNRPRPLQDPLPITAKRVVVRMDVEHDDGTTTTFAIHNVGFNPHRVDEGLHGVVMDVEQPVTRSRIPGVIRGFEPDGPAQLCLTIRGDLNPDDDSGHTHTVTVTRTPEADE